MRVVSLIGFLFCVACATPESTSADGFSIGGLRLEKTTRADWYFPEDPPTADFESRAISLHPAISYQYARDEFDAGRKENAGLWMYIGQFRYRALLTCKGAGPWNPEYDAFIAMREDVGTTVNGWLGGDLQLWADTVHEAIEWYEGANDSFVPSPKCDEARARKKDDMNELIDFLVKDPDGFRAQRAENGLENRTEGAVTDPR